MSWVDFAVMVIAMCIGNLIAQTIVAVGRWLRRR